MCISLEHPAEMKAQGLGGSRPTWIERNEPAMTEYAAGVPLQDASSKTRLFQTGATREVDNNKLDYEGFISPKVLRRYAEYMHKCRLRNIPPNQEVRSSDNWQKGIPKEAYMKSLIRHTFEAWEATREAELPEPGSEAFRDTLCAIMFNVMGYLFEDMRNG